MDTDNSMIRIRIFDRKTKEQIGNLNLSGTIWSCDLKDATLARKVEVVAQEIKGIKSKYSRLKNLILLPKDPTSIAWYLSNVFKGTNWFYRHVTEKRKACKKSIE